MYTLVDPKSFWPQLSAMPTNQIYMTPVPVTPTYLIGGTTPQLLSMPVQTPNATTPVPMYYNIQPSWCPQTSVPAVTSSHRPRASSDDVFILDNPVTDNYSSTNVLPPCHTSSKSIRIPHKNDFHPKRRQRVKGAAYDDDMSLDSGGSHRDEISRERSSSGTNNSSSFSSHFSSGRSNGQSSGASSLRSSSPQQMDNSQECLNQSLHHRETTTTNINDYSLFNLFSTSLYSALNQDPPEPHTTKKSESNLVVPLKTSSPKPEEQFADRIQTPFHDNVLTRMQAETLGAQSHNLSDENIPEQSGNRRQKFLKALEDERERQRSLLLPKHAPKMNCKFCKNNGESPEVYTKHRLHFKEKTVCPLLRMYVCRLCNSTGDFAHTIRHCPFNSRFDKIAWKATFL